MIIRFKGHIIECKPGANLRDTLLRNGLSPHNGSSRLLNCRGLGTCGTCAVEIVGLVNTPTAMEKWRFSFVPYSAQHHPAGRFRLACQCEVVGDLEVVKHPGFWGEKKSSSTAQENIEEPK